MIFLRAFLVTSLLFLLSISNVLAVTIENPLGPGTTISSTIGKIATFLLQLGTAVSAIVFIVGGFQYLFSFGEEKKITNAKNTLWYGVVGLVVLLLAQGVSGFIQNVIK